MGCGSSKPGSTAIVAFESTSTKRPSRPISAPINDPANGAASGKSESLLSKLKKPLSASSKKGQQQRPESGAVASVSAVEAFRGNSAASDRSIDSGIGNGSRDGSANLERPLVPPKTDPRSAQQLPANLSTLKAPADRPARPRVDEESILASLRQEGLLTDPNTSTSKGGLCFEVSAEELKVRSRRPPARLQRLEPTQPSNMTKDNIRQKLASAENRRRKRETDKVQRNRDKDAKFLETKLASLDMDNPPEEANEPQKPSDRIISAKHRRRPPSGAPLMATTNNTTTAPPLAPE